MLITATVNVPPGLSERRPIHLQLARRHETALLANIAQPHFRKLAKSSTAKTLMLCISSPRYPGIPGFATTQKPGKTRKFASFRADGNILMRKEGFEPPWPFGLKNLSLRCWFGRRD